MYTTALCQECSQPCPEGRRKFCCRNHAARWYARRNRADPEKREKHNARQREKYWKNPGAATERLRAWRAKNPEAQKEIERRNRDKHRETIYARNREFRSENPDYIREYSVKLYEETRIKAPWTNSLRARMRHALKKRIPFELSATWAKARWTGYCELTGLPFNLSRNVVSFYSPSIDRIVPEKGYLPDNCRFVLNAINGFKSNGTDADMLLAARALVAKLSN